MNKLAVYISLLRLSHWSKSIFVLFGFFYTPIHGYFIPALLASLAFCFISSAVYIYNDIHDRKEDRIHPHKKNRPLASKTIALSEAMALFSLLLVVGLLLGWLISKQLLIILVTYILVNLAYNHLLKLIAILDVLCIAIGFMLRVLAGTIGIGLSLSIWLTVAATLLSLFIALNKRRLELQLGLKHSTRKVLKKYHPLLLQRLILGTGAACFIVYLFYVIYVRSESFYFILTLPFAGFALWRFAWLSMQNVENDDPVDVFINDRLSRVNLWCFAVLTFMALTHST
jgi:4-hydroxybenzoate polyprenyltransferase